MAKTLSQTSVANAFAEYNNVVILDGIGGKNTETETATTYCTFVTDGALSYLNELRQWSNNNWEAKVFKHPDGTAYSVQEKLDAISKLAETYEPKEPKAQTPLKRAVQNILCRMNPLAVQGLAGSTLAKAVAPDVEAFLQSASLEKYRSEIEAELVTIRNETGKRSRRDGEPKAETGVGFKFQRADDEVSEAAE